MGAWIETDPRVSLSPKIQLLPLWEHGLKPRLAVRLLAAKTLLPLWEHGLKRYSYSHFQRFKGVAPFMGAWIETRQMKEILEHQKLLPLWEHGLKLKFGKYWSGY